MNSFGKQLASFRGVLWQWVEPWWEESKPRSGGAALIVCSNVIDSCQCASRPSE